MDKYEIIESYCSDRFKDYVNSHLEDGWVLRGEMQIVKVEEGIRFYQAMVLPFKVTKDKEAHVKVKYHITDEDKITFTPGLMGFPER
jgi:hypothetical protein